MERLRNIYDVSGMTVECKGERPMTSGSLTPDKSQQRMTAMALIDIGNPGFSGIEGLVRLRERYPSSALMVVTAFDDDDWIYKALCAGASGYLLKDKLPTKLLEGIQEVVARAAPMPSQIAQQVVSWCRTIQSREDFDLTPHELRILRLLVNGHSYKRAASEMGRRLLYGCVSRANIYQKLQVHSKSEAVSKALRSTRRLCLRPAPGSDTTVISRLYSTLSGRVSSTRC
jgi:DNA-binding NarL/FixJ family response regulator